MSILNWVPIPFIEAQSSFLVADKWDTLYHQFGHALRDKFPTSVVHELKSPGRSAADPHPCAVLNPQWTDPQMKIAGGTPLQDMIPILLDQFSALMVVGKSLDNQAGEALLKAASAAGKLSDVRVLNPPSCSVYLLSLTQSMSSKLPTGAGAAAAAAAAAAATGGRGGGEAAPSSSVSPPSGSGIAAAAAAIGGGGPP